MAVVAISSDDASEPFGLWGRAFRPFFLLLALQALIFIPWWLLVWTGALVAPSWLTPVWWHGHEMIFGFVSAAVAGFLLTASPVWVGGRALTGRPLASLAMLWVLGRLAIASSGTLPPWLIAAVDVAFLPAAALAVARTLWGSGQIRNYGIVSVVLALATANAFMHAQAIGLATGVAGPALRFAVDIVVVLVLVVAGRITPAFTQNAFRVRRVERSVRVHRWIGALAIGAAAGLAFVAPLFGRSPISGLLAMLGGFAVAGRLVGWQTWHVRSDPLLWSLHVGSLWVAIGLLLVAASDLGIGVPPTAGLHALTAGAMGSTVLAVITRVSLGHTGRALNLPPGVVWCYVLVNGGAAARVMATVVNGHCHLALLVASGLAWSAAFGIFLVRYARILVAPRVDGRPG